MLEKFRKFPYSFYPYWKLLFIHNHSSCTNHFHPQHASVSWHTDSGNTPSPRTGSYCQCWSGHNLQELVVPWFSSSSIWIQQQWWILATLQHPRWLQQATQPRTEIHHHPCHLISSQEQAQWSSHCVRAPRWCSEELVIVQQPGPEFPSNFCRPHRCWPSHRCWAPSWLLWGAAHC